MKETKENKQTKKNPESPAVNKSPGFSSLASKTHRTTDAGFEFFQGSKCIQCPQEEDFKAHFLQPAK